MKKIIVAATLALVVCSGAYASVGSGREGNSHEFSGKGRGIQEPDVALKLTANQEAEINSLIQAERLAAAPLVKQMREKLQQLMQAAETSTFDEGSVRAIAAASANIEAELLVLRVRTQTRIYTLLTAEQRETVKNLNANESASSPVLPEK